MAGEPTYRAGKPTLTVYPIIARDALRFRSKRRRPPPAGWWIGLRRYATADKLLARPWDEPAQNTLTVECPDAASLATVIEAVGRVLDRANRDYADQLAAGVAAQERFQAENDPAPARTRNHHP